VRVFVGQGRCADLPGPQPLVDDTYLNHPDHRAARTGGPRPPRFLPRATRAHFATCWPKVWRPYKPREGGWLVLRAPIVGRHRGRSTEASGARGAIQAAKGKMAATPSDQIRRRSRARTCLQVRPSSGGSVTTRPRALPP
jgi:hypothetical protein